MSPDHAPLVRRILSDRPAFHLGGTSSWNSLPQTLEAIHRAAHEGQTTLETGVGASTVVFAAAGAHHTAISPDGDEHRRVADYCRRIGVDTARLTFIEGLSGDVLPELLSSERTLDAAFIDGAHSFPFPEVDWFYVTRALRVGGRLLMDDVPIPAVAPLFTHMRLDESWRFERILDHRAAEFTLVAEPQPEDWPAQRFNDGYPDYSFAPLLARVGLTTRFRAGRAWRAIGARHPAVRRAARGAAGGLAARARG